MLGEACQERFAIGELEVGEVEAGRDSSADERVAGGIINRRAVPAAGGHEHLKALAPFGIGPESLIFQPSVRMDQRSVSVLPA